MGTKCSSACLGPFEDNRHYLHYLHHNFVTGKEHSSTHQQETGLKIYWAWPCPSEQDPVSPSVSLSHQEGSISLLPFSIRGQTDWNHSKLTSLITWTTALSNSMKLWAMPCRATQDGQVMVESSDRMWSTGEGNCKPLQYSCLENPMNSKKRQKHRTWKMNFLGRWKWKWSRPVVSDSVTPWTVAYQVPKSMGFSRQEYCRKWIAISFSRGSSWPRDGTQVSRIVGRCFTVLATREVTPRQ